MENKMLCSFSVSFGNQPPSVVPVLFMTVIGLACAVIGVFTGWYNMAFALLLPVATWAVMKNQRGFDIYDAENGNLKVTRWKKFFGPKQIISETQLRKKNIKHLYDEKNDNEHKLSLQLNNKTSIELITVEQDRHAVIPREMIKQTLNCKVQIRVLDVI